MDKKKKIDNPYLKGYLDAISMILMEKDLPVPSDLFENMVAFALESHDEHIVESWQIGKAVEIIRDRDLKKKFVYRHVFLTKKDNSSFFSVYDEDSANTAERIIAEFPFDDKLAQKLESSLNKWNLKSSTSPKPSLPHWSQKVLV
jgi:hypothetical protein